jgi:hypothetical protein
MQDSRAVRADLDASAELAKPRALLVDVHIQAAREQRECGSETADAAADHGDPVRYGHFRIPMQETKQKFLPRPSGWRRSARRCAVRRRARC